MDDMDLDVNDRIDALMLKRYPEVVRKEQEAWEAMMSVEGEDEILKAQARWANAARTYRDHTEILYAELERGSS